MSDLHKLCITGKSSASYTTGNLVAGIRVCWKELALSSTISHGQKGGSLHCNNSIHITEVHVPAM